MPGGRRGGIPAGGGLGSAGQVWRAGRHQKDLVMLETYSADGRIDAQLYGPVKAAGT